MSKKLNELRHQRNQLVTQARGILDKADSEKRGLLADEQQSYDALFNKQEELRKTIEAEERQIELERQMADHQMRGAGGGDDGGRGGENRGATGPRGTEEYRAAYDVFIRGGKDALNPDQVRALSAGAGSEGGFIVAPEQTVETLIQALDDEVFIRRYATKFTVTNSQSLGAASLDADPADADWTSEIATGSEDGSMSLGKRELAPNPLAKRIKVSEKLLRLNPRSEPLVISRLAYKFGITEEKAFMVANGSKKPLGLFVASNDGIPTSRDVSAGNGATSIGMDGLIAAKYSLKAGYLRKARWLFHRDAIKQIAQLREGSGTGQYLWEPSKKAGEPDMLLGLPLDMSEYVPNTFTTGQYVGMIADYSHYWIVDALDVTIKRLVELYAETNQIGFIARKETDGMPVLAEAFARVKLA